ncbi:sporulation inhibitor of replication protein SirA [Fictibacillus iocasae]|uniref:Sporulation inhibitor of replication protein SirA n=1 Tax=Fictibacillus iocasae TaxID=2715437 RepID=A0ABW2NP72_9BACL
MRGYFLYKIREDVAHEFYGKESKIFSLFLEERKSKNADKRSIAQKQTAYITLPIEAEKLMSYLWRLSVPGSSFDTRKNVFSITLSKSEVHLYLNRDYLMLESRGTFDAETTMFELLRKVETRFLAMDFEAKKYGWLFPVKLNSFYGA